MKLHPLLTACAALLALVPGPAAAQTTAVPGLISYQGRVVDAAGANVGAGTPVNRTVIFRIWDSPSSTNTANLIYSESQTVTVSEGEFSVLVGQGVANGTQTFGYSESGKFLADLGTAFNGSARYLGVTVAAAATIALTDNEITPRQQIVSTAFAMRAKFAESIGSSSDLALTPLSGTASNYGLGWYGTGRLFGGTAVDGPVLYGNAGGALGSNVSGTQNTALRWDSSGRVGIGTTTPTVALDVTGAIKASGAVTGGSFATSLGNVGIGTLTPTARLDIVDGTTAGTYGSVQISRPANGHTGSHLAFVRAGGQVMGMGYGQSSTTFGLGKLTSQNVFSPNILSIDANSNVGIGTATPGFPLSMADTLGDKIALYGSLGNHFGLGVQNNQFQIHTDTNAADVVFGYGTSAAMTETMRIKGNGNVGIGTATPGFKLDVAGSARVSGQLNVGGAVVMGESQTIYGMSGAEAQPAFWPRASNGTYLNYGTSGLFIRNNASTLEMYLNGGRLGVGTTDTSQGAITTTTTGFTSTGTANNGATSYARMSYQPTRGGIAFDVFNSGQVPNLWRGFSYDGNSDIDFYSDRNLKKDIVDAEPMLDRLMQVPFRRFRWKDVTNPAVKPEFGVIAQEVEPLFPDLVSTGSDGMKTVGYTTFATITAKALQEYKARNDADLKKLNAQIQEKDAEIQALRDETAALRREFAAKDESVEARLIALERRMSGEGEAKTVSLKTAKVAE